MLSTIIGLRNIPSNNLIHIPHRIIGLVAIGCDCLVGTDFRSRTIGLGGPAGKALILRRNNVVTRQGHRVAILDGLLLAAVARISRGIGPAIGLVILPRAFTRHDGHLVGILLIIGEGVLLSAVLIERFHKSGSPAAASLVRGVGLAAHGGSVQSGGAVQRQLAAGVPQSHNLRLSVGRLVVPAAVRNLVGHLALEVIVDTVAAVGARGLAGFHQLVVLPLGIDSDVGVHFGVLGERIASSVLLRVPANEDRLILGGIGGHLAAYRLALGHRLLRNSAAALAVERHRVGGLCSIGVPPGAFEAQRQIPLPGRAGPPSARW